MTFEVLTSSCIYSLIMKNTCPQNLTLNDYPFMDNAKKCVMSLMFNF